jgi:redox-sensitive bicupin YhaK (pirin superfamily)
MLMKSQSSNVRKALAVSPAQPTMEGAGVRLKRAFGAVDPRLDPFLMLDDFSSRDPADYEAGFPEHPHRGMETVTYIISGQVDHRDSLGNSGTIRSGEVQWMTAGSGIIHAEMPRETWERLCGVQLWVNLPRESKMMTPRYRDIREEDIPVVEPSPGIRVKVIAGTFDGAVGPVKDVVVKILYLDVAMGPNTEFRHDIPGQFNAFAYVVQGDADFGGSTAGRQQLVVLGKGEEVQVRSGEKGARFILAAGQPIGEPVAWRGPVVMNTEGELKEAFREMREGTFVKTDPLR